jgi:outer membrane protein assembly factor BamB
MNVLTAVDSVTGTVIWEFQASPTNPPDTLRPASPDPIVVGDRVVMIDGAGIVHAIDRQSGEIAWSQGGFAGMDARMAWQKGVLFVLASSREGELTGTALDLDTGEPLWTIGLNGPLFQPVALNETFFYLIADEVTETSALDATYDPIEDHSGSGLQQWIGSKASLEDDAGGSHIFGIDANTGEVIWLRSSMAGGFVQLMSGCPNDHYCPFSALTSDGQLISLAGDNGAIINDPTLYPEVFGGIPKVVRDYGFGELGSFATLEDGALISYGATPFNEMG